jgi:hypothetical protein
MNARAEAGEGSANPFSTRHTRPGALAYLFPPGDSLDGVFGRLFAATGPCEIIGPHGAGKSTLVATLADAIAARGSETLVLRPIESRLPPEATRIEELPRDAVVFFDGYEQLSRWTRGRLRKACERRGARLVVTGHESFGLTPLVNVQPDLATAQRVVRSLVGGRTSAICEADVEKAYTATGGNLRETLFVLYDLVERSR